MKLPNLKEISMYPMFLSTQGAQYIPYYTILVSMFFSIISQITPITCPGIKKCPVFGMLASATLWGICIQGAGWLLCGGGALVLQNHENFYKLCIPSPNMEPQHRAM